ncbi:MAG: hypothetical protein EOO38_32500, partial [Cytophagaceae bacterium]
MPVPRNPLAARALMLPWKGISSVTRRHLINALLGLSTLPTLLATGCGGGKQEDGSGTPDPAGRGAAEGYAFTAASGGIVLYPT